MDNLDSPDADGEAMDYPVNCRIRSIQDLDAVIEVRDPISAAFKYTTFHVFADDDVVFFGRVSKPKSDITIEDINRVIKAVPDHIIFPFIPVDKEITVAPELDGEYHVKRPNMSLYELFKNDGFLATILLSEAAIMEHIAKHPHPNIVHYYGVRMRRDHITGLVLAKHRHTLQEHVKQGLSLNEEAFMKALESAVASLHSLRLAHNDINPENIMVNSDNMPVLIDFGSCRPFEKVSWTEGWVDTMDSFSKKEHDLFALSKLREWLQSPSTQ